MSTPVHLPHDHSPDPRRRRRSRRASAPGRAATGTPPPIFNVPTAPGYPAPALLRVRPPGATHQPHESSRNLLTQPPSARPHLATYRQLSHRLHHEQCLRKDTTTPRTYLGPHPTQIDDYRQFSRTTEAQASKTCLRPSATILPLCRKPGCRVRRWRRRSLPGWSQRNRQINAPFGDQLLPHWHRARSESLVRIHRRVLQIHTPVFPQLLSRAHSRQRRRRRRDHSCLHPGRVQVHRHQRPL